MGQCVSKPASAGGNGADVGSGLASGRRGAGAGAGGTSADLSYSIPAIDHPLAGPRAYGASSNGASKPATDATTSSTSMSTMSISATSAKATTTTATTTTRTTKAATAPFSFDSQARCPIEFSPAPSLSLSLSQSQPLPPPPPSSSFARKEEGGRVAVTFGGGGGGCPIAHTPLAAAGGGGEAGTGTGAGAGMGMGGRGGRVLGRQVSHSSLRSHRMLLQASRVLTTAASGEEMGGASSVKGDASPPSQFKELRDISLAQTAANSSMNMEDNRGMKVGALLSDCQKVMDVLDAEYGAAAGFSRSSDVVVVTEAWNKALAFKTMWNEAMVSRWRVLVAREQLKREEEEEQQTAEAEAADAVVVLANAIGAESVLRKASSNSKNRGKNRATYTLMSRDDGDDEAKKESGWNMARGRTAGASGKKGPGSADPVPADDDSPLVAKKVRGISARTSSSLSVSAVKDKKNAALHRRALSLVENNRDPLAAALETRMHHFRDVLTAMIDQAVRSLCPQLQKVQREAYRPINDDLRLAVTVDRAAAEMGGGNPEGAIGMGGAGEGGYDLRRFALLEGTMEEYCRLFARCGVLPWHWTHFVDAFLWTMATHNPYGDETDAEDLALPTSESAHSAFAAAHIAKPAVEAIVKLHSELDCPVFRVGVRRFWERVSATDDAKADVGEKFYRQLLIDHPELLDYFAKADMDSLSLHLVLAIDLLVKSSSQIGMADTGFRRVLEHLGEMHRKLGIPTFAFPIVGGQLLKTLRPYLEEEEILTQDDEYRCSADELEQAFAVLYMEVMAVVFYPMVQEEKLIHDAEQFYQTVAKELNWSPDRLSRRLLEVTLEIQNTGTYTHTSEELELGARLAWRNSAKCIGRIAWNTLEVRDCRHVTSAAGMFREVEEHMRIATAGTNIQSVMTVFKPKSRSEAWGARFWNSQYVRYAGYEDEDGTVIGDPANLEFTDYLVRRGLWAPPDVKSHFDVLPLVLKIPGRQRPYVHHLPKELVDEVEIEHPTCPAIKGLGLRWAAVPAISNFNMNLGGVHYQCSPFNGWFVSIEIVRNLMERYNVTKRWADAMGLDKSQKMIEIRVQHEIQCAVLHSFSTKGFTMVDPVTVGNSFLVHCKRERDQGRECPGQWSWIGGLVGPTNVTWHREMRDFELLPQYEYCCDPWKVTEAPTPGSSRQSQDLMGKEIDEEEPEAEEDMQLPRVLIVYGSETGTAEAAANRMGASLRLLKPIVKSLNSVAGLDIVAKRKITHLIAICSTFNRGEFPSNARIFQSTKVSPGTLSETKCAVLALGSSLYPDYCAAGLMLNGILTKAGGQPMVPMNKVDDATASEGPIADWLQLVRRLVMPAPMESMLLARGGNAIAPLEHRMRWGDAFVNVSEALSRFAWSEGDAVDCVENVELMAGGGDIDVRSTRKLTFRLPAGATYSSGDHLSVIPLNALDMVVRFARCFSEELIEAAAASGSCPVLDKGNDAILRWQLQQPFSIDTIDNNETYPAHLTFNMPSTLAEVLQAYVDLSLRSSQVGDLLALIKGLLDRVSDDMHPDCEEMKAHLMKFHRFSIDGTSMMKKKGIDEFLSHYPTLMDFLEYYCPLLCTKKAFAGGENYPVLPLAELLVFLPRLQARYYSISSSPQADPSLVSISVGVVHADTMFGVKLHGVCSNYLARIRPMEDRVAISVKKSSFNGPKNLKSHVIMVGTGTGLSPMMGFLFDRAHAIESMSQGIEVGECHLFFGCRDENDRIYTDIVDKWEESGVLTHHLALSRAPHRPKAYVQDLLEKYGARLCQLLLQDDTCYYVCGDAKVADYCYEACVSVLRKYGHMSRVAAVQRIKLMRAQGRWQYDLWGIISHFNESKLDTRKKKEATAKTWLLNFT